jgi:ubiquitin carboxyl-terminal hydrolase 10
MLQKLRNDIFPIEGRQEDAEEFLSFILNKMNDEMIEVRLPEKIPFIL